MVVQLILLLRSRRLWAVFGLLVLAALILAAVDIGYDYPWTGFGSYEVTSPPTRSEPKRLWDWLQIGLIPAIIALGAFWLQRGQTKSQQRNELDRQRQASLDDYLRHMRDLMLIYYIHDPVYGRKARSFADTITVATVQRLDPDRKAQLLEFLSRSGLINRDGSGNPIVSLVGANLSGINLSFAVMTGVAIRGAYLNNATFEQACITKSDFSSSQFKNASFDRTDFRFNTAKQCNFNNASFTKTNMQHTISDYMFTKRQLRGMTNRCRKG